MKSGVKAALALAAIVATCTATTRHASAHGFGSAITWNREVSRIVFDRCASCHRPGGTAFSLMTYADVQPRANAIKDAVLARRMPPWGAVKGFGHFRNDASLTQEQIELVTKWVDGGIRRGNNPRLLPPTPSFPEPAASRVPNGAVQIRGTYVLAQALVIDGLQAEHVAPALSARIVATLPGGVTEPLVWLQGYNSRFAHPFLLRRPMTLPAGTRIDGVPTGATLLLLPVAR